MSNPLVDRILSNPLTFVPAKEPEKETHGDQTAGYIVLGKKSSDNLLPNMLKPKAAKVEVKRPKSMAEAIAAYTGKKYMSKAEKKKMPKPAALEPDSSEDESKYESASEFQTDSSFHGFRSSTEGTPEVKLVDENELANDDSDDYEEEAVDGKVHGDGEAAANAQEEGDENELSDDSDAEFKLGDPTHEDTADSGSESDSSSSNSGSDNLDGDAEDDADGDVDGELDSNIEGDANDDVEGDVGEDVDGDRLQLKQDLLADKKTPPTSPEDGSEPAAVQKEPTPEVLSRFYRPNDAGANGSGRITKSWTAPYLNSRPMGLLNFGVTCYMNLAIQAMLHIPAVQHYLEEVNNGKHTQVKPRSVTHTLAELSSRMWKSGSGSRKYVNPKKIVQRLEDINCMMSEWQQEDLHEYFMSLMARLQEDLTPSGAKLNLLVLYDIFGGLLDQEVVCQECHTVSKTQQEFYDLSVGLNKKRKAAEEVPAGRYSIDKSIADFFSLETIRKEKSDDASGYLCDKCHKRTVATKKSTIAESPQTLLVHMKRFKFNGNSLSKVKQPILYRKYVDLTPYTTTGEESQYQLMAVIVHEGRLILSGHYIAHCLQPDGTWATYDDEYINKLDERSALSDPSAYCLVYTRLTAKKKREVETDGRGAKRAKVA